MEPGTYVIQTHPTSDTTWRFEVTAQGSIAYANGLDVSEGGFLTGRGTNTFGIAGFPITLESPGLAAERCPHLANITGWLPSNREHVLKLLPGKYQFMQGNGPVPEADFQVRIDGKVEYPTSSDGFLTGRDSTTFGIVGFPITLESRGLAAYQYHLASITGWLTSNREHVLKLLPGKYQFMQGNGPVPEADFQVRIDGKVEYPTSSDGFLTGRDSTTFGIVGFPITLESRGLAAYQYHLASITGWLTSEREHVLNLLPGKYQFVQGNGPVPEADFQVRLDGKVEYPTSSDGFLTGRDSTTFGIVGFPIVLKSPGLATYQYHLASITGWLPSEREHVLNLLPGKYQFVQGNGLVPEADFQVRIDGKVEYPTSSDGFLTGRDSTTFGIVGFPIVLKSPGLAAYQYHLASITGWLTSDREHELRLLPGKYQFMQGNGPVADVLFSVLLDGTPAIDSSRSGAIMSLVPANATSPPTVVFSGHAIDLDFTELSSHRYRLDVTDWFENDRVHSVRLMPTRYHMVNAVGAIDRGVFDVLAGGNLNYADELDLANGGYLTGAGTATLTVMGFPLGIDATAIAGTDVTIAPEGIAIDSNAGTVQTVRLLPQYDIQLNLDTAPGQTAVFDLAGDGFVILLEPYPFAVLDELDGHPLIRLTHDLLRQKTPCRRPVLIFRT